MRKAGCARLGEHNNDRSQFGRDRQEREHEVVQDHLVTRQTVLQRLADPAGLPIQMKAQRQSQDVREETAAQHAEHSPLSTRIHETADLTHGSRQKLAQDIGPDENRWR